MVIFACASRVASTAGSPSSSPVLKLVSTRPPSRSDWNSASDTVCVPRSSARIRFCAAIEYLVCREELTRIFDFLVAIVKQRRKRRLGLVDDHPRHAGDVRLGGVFLLLPAKYLALAIHFHPHVGQPRGGERF